MTGRPPAFRPLTDPPAAVVFPGGWFRANDPQQKIKVMNEIYAHGGKVVFMDGILIPARANVLSINAKAPQVEPIQIPWVEMDSADYFNAFGRDFDSSLYDGFFELVAGAALK